MTQLSIIIVNYNSRDFLEGCVESVYRETTAADFELIVVDNASKEQDFSHLQRNHPRAHLLLNETNRGFAAACNQGIRYLPARFYLLLNPDCRILDRAIDKSVKFLESRPQAGIVGCRVNNPDGSLQPACRRSIPRPSTAFYRFSGLSFLFPKSETFARYNLSYLDDRMTHEVEAVSGSFLMFRHGLLENIGYLDEKFFLYGEDLDFCYRANLEGWKVFYYPEAQVIHYQYQSSRKNARATAYHFYDAMEIFYRKYYYRDAHLLQNLLALAAIRLARVMRRAP